jgi:predicted tellurium resistance membrane protein TerC
MWREIREGQMKAVPAEPAPTVVGNPGPEDCDAPGSTVKYKTLGQALTAIVVADVSMSLDNVLAVAGAAHNYLWILIFGLTLSIALMAVAWLDAALAKSRGQIRHKSQSRPPETGWPCLW